MPTIRMIRSLTRGKSNLHFQYHTYTKIVEQTIDYRNPNLLSAVALGEETL
jgi:hypothetical protein